MGLLLLRALCGLTAVVQGGVYLSSRGTPTLREWVLGVITLAVGASLLIGFLTPVASVLSGLGSIATAFSSSPGYVHNLPDNGLSVLFVTVVAAAVVLLGPGAYSLDARLFGRREIIIPQATRPDTS